MSRSAAEAAVSSSDELAYLNREHSYALAWKSEEGTTQPLTTRLRARFAGWLRAKILGPYFSAEQEYHAHLVRALNEIAARLDAGPLRAADAAELSLHSVDRQIAQGVAQAFADINRRQNELEAENIKLQAQLATLDSVSQGLERIIARLAPMPRPAEAPAGASAPVDYSYLLLENRYRGSEDEIRARLSRYPDLFSAAGPEPVLEIGAGRGELQQLFASRGIRSYGIELDEAMASVCCDKGLDVRSAEAIEHLRGVQDGSLSGVIAIQVVEHLPHRVLLDLLRLCSTKVKRGGRIVFETINTESVVALCRNYFRDPTHSAPLHPDTMRYLMELSGLKVLSVDKLSPYPEAALLKELPVEEYFTPRWAATVERVNEHVRQLNSLLYGHQDYAIVAEPA